MPRMDTPSPSESLAKLLLIGDGKVGKTHYAGMAAAAGFNVLYFDGDVGRPTLASLPIEARKRIYALDVADTIRGGVKDSRFIDTMKEFSALSVFRWNDTKSQIAARNKDDPTDEIWEIRPAAMDHTCVFVLDSWTGLSESMMSAAAIAHSVDIADATTSEMRPVYQSSGLKSVQMLQVIRSMRCHVIVLAHPDEFSHTTKPDGRKVKDIKETELTVDWTKMIPKSTSKPNSLQMAKYFTDVAWAEVNGSGSQRLLNFRLDEGRISGGHFNDRKSVDEYSFANLVKQIGGHVPQGDVPVDHWLRIIPGSEVIEGEVVASSPTPSEPVKALQGNSSAGAKSISGLAGLSKRA